MPILKAVVIDDEPVVLAVLRRVLQRRGYDVHSYEDPVDSPLHKSTGCPCSLNDEGCPDLIISDFNMLGVNGVELLESTMKKGCRCRHLALISGRGILETDLMRLAKYGTRHFTKPLNLDDFNAWLDRIERPGI